ncbi:(Na+)-NQR maturation NqrM [Mangrovitalea sediminis]|uniref:(Na+)-NQR maturation NqrM n=1 Tax=Mangrovitalea sediminis TaxID=1982043 RepID=UPI000BE4DBB4|nr:(Na+)-NQR maturation NqrM [Mangrovitalea sediminis]
MSTFILVFLVFCVMIAAMSIGVMFGRKPLKGSCGGMSALGIDTACEICGGNRSKCEEVNARAASPSDLAYDATKQTGAGQE